MSEFRVQLDCFYGPLDLLLFLVRRSELAIVDIPLAQITRQFVDYLKSLPVFDPSDVSEFVVTAATLAEIKSSAVIPQPPEDDEPEAEADESVPQSELIRRLLEYKRFKDAAAALQQRATEWLERYPRLSDERPGQSRDPAADRIRDVELWDLVSAFSRLLEQQTLEAEAQIRNEEVPLAVYIEEVAERVRREGRVAFTSFFTPQSSRSEWVGRFLAVLELVRHRGFRARQDHDFAEIWILPPANLAASA